MKINSYLALTTIVLSFATCKKSDSRDADLNGKWELASVQGSWVGYRTFPRGNGNTYRFNNDSYIATTHYGDSTVEQKGKFSIFTGKPCEAAKEQQLIQFDLQSPFPTTFLLSGNTFTIAAPSECIMDGGSSTYRKIE